MQPLNLILNTAQESFCHFNCLQWLAHSCPASSMLIMCMQLEVRKKIISSEVCAMFLTQDDDLAQQHIVADFLLLWSLVAYCTTLYDDITESILQFKICCTRSKFVSFMWNRMKICDVMWCDVMWGVYCLLQMVEEKITCYEAEEPSARYHHQYFFLDPYAASLLCFSGNRLG